MSLDRVRLMPQPYSTEKLVYSLSNYTCNGTEAKVINTGLRIYNATDFPYGYKIEFEGTITVTGSTAHFGTWFACMDESGSPWPGITLRQFGTSPPVVQICTNSNNEQKETNIANTADTVGAKVTVTVTYNNPNTFFEGTYRGQKVTNTCAGKASTNNTLLIGATWNSTATGYIRYGYVQIDSFKVYKLLPKKSNITYGNFGGLMFTPGPLVYENGNYRVQETWNEANSFGTIQGPQEGSTYFSFVDVGRRFDSRGSSFSTSSGDINNGNPLSFDKFNDWRIPTQSEIKLLIGAYLYEGRVDGTPRNGSTVNGVSNKHFSVITTNLSYAGNTSSNISGFLIFPDGKTITGKTLLGYDNFTKTAGFTSSDIDTYLKQGCLFFPESGLYYNYAWSSREGRFSSLTATSDPTSSSKFYIVGFGTVDDGYLDAHSTVSKTSSQFRFLVYLCRTI